MERLFTESSYNRVVLPTNVSVEDRNRERLVVYYGRVSSEHEAQLSALENQMQWYDDQTKYHPGGRLYISILTRELQVHRRKRDLHLCRCLLMPVSINLT